MNINWIEDFLSLADTRGFSRSAIQRHASQPAFGRRIQSLESRVGTELADPGSNRPSLARWAGPARRRHCAAAAASPTPAARGASAPDGLHIKKQ